MAFVAVVSPVAPAPAQAALLAGTHLDVSSCFWSVQTDGWTDGYGFDHRFAHYSLQSVFTDLPGGHWEFRGQYPKARWISFESYDSGANSQGFITGRDLHPDAGATNPFAPGGEYKPLGGYTADWINAPPKQRDRQAHNVLYGGYRMNPQYGGFEHSAIEEVLYRVYAPPSGASHLGDVPNPDVSWVVDDPATNPFTDSAQACASLNAATYSGPPSISSIVGLGLEKLVAWTLVPVLRDGVNIASPNVANPPAVNVGRPGSNGWTAPGFNSAAADLEISTGRSLGPLLVVRFKAPTFARVQEGERPTGREQVTYWDWCSGVLTPPATYDIGCHRDEQYQVDRDGYATLVISDEDDHPIVNGEPYPDWIPMGNFSIMRLFSSNPQTFPQSPYFLPANTFSGIDPSQDFFVNELDPKPLQQFMGDYYPQARYCTTEQFETDRCGFPLPKANGPGDVSGRRYETRFVRTRRAGRTYTGEISSGAVACTLSRTIRLRTVGRHGRVLGTARTLGDGTFTIRLRRTPQTKVYLSVANERTNTLVCDGARSKVLAG